MFSIKSGILEAQGALVVAEQAVANDGNAAAKLIAPAAEAISTPFSALIGPSCLVTSVGVEECSNTQATAAHTSSQSLK